MNIINPIIINSYNNQPLSTPRQGGTLGGLTQDVFVRSNNNISFGSNDKLNKKFFGFSKDLVAYVNSTSDIKLEEVENIIKKYSSQTAVKPMAEIPESCHLSPATGAYFSSKLVLHPSGDVETGDNIIFIDLPKDKSLESKIRFLDFLSHEMTHVLQEESTDRVSKESFYKDYIGGKELDSDKVNNIAIMPKVFSLVEFHLQLPLLENIHKERFMPEVIPDCSRKALDKIYSEMTDSKSLDDYVETLINRTFDLIEVNYNTTIDRKGILKYMTLCAEKEKEAYCKSTNLIKNELKIKKPTDFDLRNMLYDSFVEKTREMSK